MSPWARRRRADRHSSPVDNDTPVVEGYEQLRILGEGGSATVYRATEVAFNRVVALKVFRRDGISGPGMERIDYECQALGRLQNAPNVVVPFSRGMTPDGHVWLSMEYFPRGSLADQLALTGPFPLDELVGHVDALASALSASHGIGMIHRDVKPENAFIGEGDPPVTKLADFGISVSSGIRADTSVLLAMSLHHAAPETLDGLPPTIASDVYSLASTTYQLLNGHPPFPVREHDTWSSAALRIMREDPQPMARADLPAEVEAVLARGLAKDPADRFAGAREFAEALREAARLPVTSPSPDPTPPPWATASGALSPDVDPLDDPPPAPQAVFGPATAIREIPSTDGTTPARADRPRTTAGPPTTEPSGSTTDDPARATTDEAPGSVDVPLMPGTGGATVHRPLPVEPDAPDDRDDDTQQVSMLKRIMIIVGMSAGVMVTVLIILGLLIDPPGPPGPTTTTTSSIPDTTEIAGVDQALVPTDITVTPTGVAGQYEVGFEDRTGGRYDHVVFPAGGGTADAVLIEAGDTSAVVAGEPFRCVHIAVRQTPEQMGASEKVCAP